MVIATYSAFCTSNDRYRILKQIVYDTILLDEMHTAAAKTHLSLIRGLHSVYACGLTATKVREDDELKHLESEFGRDAVHAEVDRQTLADAGFVANVRVVHLVVPHGTERPVAGINSREGALLGLHPHKIQVLYSAIKRLCAEKHKIIVFCDDLFTTDRAHRRRIAFPLSGKFHEHRRRAGEHFEGHGGGGTQGHLYVANRRRSVDHKRIRVDRVLEQLGLQATDCLLIGAWRARPKSLDPIFLVIPSISRKNQTRAARRLLAAHGFKLLATRRRKALRRQESQGRAVYAAVAQSVDRPSK